MAARFCWNLFPLVILAIASGVILACSSSRQPPETAPPPPAPTGTPAPPSGEGIESFVAPSGNDANPGTQNSPWATIQHAADVAQPGATIHVAPGDYHEKIHSATSGAEGARIRFLSDVRWGARIRSSGSDSSWLNDGDYVDIAGFDISGDGRLGIFNNGSSVQIIGNHIHDIPANPCTDNGGAGIDHGNYAGSDNDTVGNVVNNIGSLSCNKVHAIYHSNARGHVWNNIAVGATGWGISLWHAATNVHIANNLVFGNGLGGILVGAGDAPGGVIDDNTLVTNNIVILNNGIGIYEFANTGINNQYVDNLVAQSGSANVSLQNGNRDIGTINALPVFNNFQLDGSGDYHLVPGSPGVGAGTTLAAPSFDIDGLSRRQNSAWDLGPYAVGVPSSTKWPYKVQQ